MIPPAETDILLALNLWPAPTHPSPHPRRPQMAKPIIQKPWQPSIVQPGNRITGRCVTSGRLFTGEVATINGPIRTPDCGGYRYLRTNTGQTYGDGSPIEPIVYAETWADLTVAAT